MISRIRPPLRRSPGVVSYEAMAVLCVLGLVGIVAFSGMGRAFDGAIEGQVRGGDARTAASKPGVGLSTQAGGGMRAAKAAAAVAHEAMDIAGRLPTRGSKAWNRYVELLRAGFAAETGPGYAILPTSKLLPESIATALREGFPDAFQGMIRTDLEHTVYGAHEMAGTTAERVLMEYEGWMKDLLADAFGRPFEQHPTGVDFRIEPAGLAANYNWHHDGRPLNASLVLTGEGTEYIANPRTFGRGYVGGTNAIEAGGDFDSRAEIVRAKRGDILVFAGKSGQDWTPVIFARDVPPLTHRSPLSEMPRVMVASRYEAEGTWYLRRTKFLATVDPEARRPNWIPLHPIEERDGIRFTEYPDVN